MNKACWITILAVLGTLSSRALLAEEPAQPVDDSPKVSPVKIEAGKKSLKRQVAIARFSNETKYGQGFFLDKSGDRIGKQAMDILSAKLAATGKFILLERADLDKVNEELKQAGKGKINIPSAHLIVGSVSEFGRKEEADVGIFSRKKKQVAYAKVNIRLIDVSTGQVIYSEEGAGDAFVETGTVLGVGGHAGYDSTLNDKALDAAISKMVSNLVENLLGKPWRAYLLALQDGAYIISGGKSQGLSVGDRLSVYKKGSVVTNPQTGMTIELPGKIVGTLQVTSTAGNDPNNEISVCQLIDGAVAESDFSNLYIQESPSR